MYLLGHLGIGRQLVKPLSRGLPVAPILIGTVFPDLLDKPLYYIFNFDLISGTQTFGHTAAGLLGFALVAGIFRSKWLAAFVLGLGSHLVLDGLTEALLVPENRQFTKALLFPLLGFEFPALPHGSLKEHLRHGMNLFTVAAELVGASLLAWDFRKTLIR